MSKLWLPFYDIGGSIGPNQPNHPLDMELLALLVHKVRARLPRTGAPEVFGLPVTAWATAFGKSGAGIEWLVTACRGLGFNVSEPSGNVATPALKNHSSLIVALNALYYRLNAADYLKPTFSASASGAISAGTLPFHMLKPESMRSAWLGISARNDGPQRELPFYDVKTTIQYNPSMSSPQGVEGIASLLLKVICNGNSPAKPSQFTTLVGPFAVINMDALPLFAEKFTQLGWFCPDATQIQPTHGNLNSPSLIVPINYFAYKVTETGGTVPGLTSLAYLHAHDSAFLPAATKSALLAGCGSRYFGV